VNETQLALGQRSVRLTNLDKIFWAGLKLTKRDLLQYYADVAHVLLPHLVDRAMVMKRYPDGAEGEPFFMKRAPSPRPAWIETCSIAHASGSVIDFPMVQDLASLLWIVNLGCIDLNPWYARTDDVDRPDFLHFDLDPVEGATFDRVLGPALAVRAAPDEPHTPAPPPPRRRPPRLPALRSRPRRGGHLRPGAGDGPGGARRPRRAADAQ